MGGHDDQLSLDEGADELGPLGRDVARLLEWGQDSPTGERSELPFEPRARAWSALSVSATECPGASRCPSGDECFAEAARRRAEEAHVVVVNTHLYAAHLASGGHLLPDHDVVVFDEAHELEDVAASSLGLELGGGRFRALARTARPVVAPTHQPVLDALEEAGGRLEDAMAAWRGRRLPHGLDEDVAAAVALAAERVARALSAIRSAEEDAARKARALQAGAHLAGDLALVAEVPPTHVAWVEGRDHAPVLKVAPVDVGEVLAARLWGEGITAVLTSATIPPNLARRLGMAESDWDELDVGSPFPFADHALLYCAAHLPDPRSRDYEAAMLEELEGLIRAAGGRTLALFTSHRAVEAADAHLSGRLPWEVLVQGTLPPPLLHQAFLEDETSVLLGTMSLWQGFDAPGPTCSLVVVDRLPFRRPDDPLAAARRDAATRARHNAFAAVDLPQAAVLLAQGAGRLVRSSHDRGVVAVLDRRLATASYRWTLVRSLPPMRRTKDPAEVRRVLGELAAAGAPAPA